MRYRGPDPTSPDAIAGLVARRKRRERERELEDLFWVSPRPTAALWADERWPEKEGWEIERERMYQERDSNEETCDRYGDL